ncbi:hypothetical protein N7466_009207 [Penicillium verhagenii]|uniref:uncharacterized protein n=1 Tax=Penicillium verhagenii TaxID=1562060 RepID=UPI00254506F2|nr:uncharacterized protein N7466_009207 [Penicillium verhagenii]KAJ5920881.1 hypothetical protein N7466_009207 [Penicillium verhagenii]
MGWVGVATLAATAAYFLYRYPPRTWTSVIPPPDSKPDAPSASFESEPNKNSPTTPPSLEKHIESPQTTPKASIPELSPPVLAVPTLNLEDSDIRIVTEPPAQSSMNGTTQQVEQVASIDRNETTTEPQRKPPSLAPLSSNPTRPAKTSSLMPPPPPPGPRLRQTPQPNRAPSGGLAPPRVSGSPRTPLSPAASARLAPAGSTGLSSSTLAPAPLSLKKSSSKKVILDPGFSPLDWAALAAKPNNQLRGKDVPPGYLRITPSMLKMQNGRKGRDAWTSYQGKVYNINPYIPYHPGGKGELLRGAGKDSGQLFQEVHPWVNWDGILNECMVGILVSEHDSQAENALDAMD